MLHGEKKTVYLLNGYACFQLCQQCEQWRWLIYGEKHSNVWNTLKLRGKLLWWCNSISNYKLFAVWKEFSLTHGIKNID